MKKMLVVLAIFIILISGFSVNKEMFSLKNYFTGELSTYSSSPLSDNFIDLGNCYMNIGEVASMQFVIGESMIINNFEPIAALSKLKAYIVKTEEVEGSTLIYAYTHLIKTNVKVNNKKVNLQIAYNDSYSVIGWPLILGSY